MHKIEIELAEDIQDFNPDAIRVSGWKFLDPIVQKAIISQLTERAELKAECTVCGGHNIHYKEGCLDCKKGGVR